MTHGALLSDDLPFATELPESWLPSRSSTGRALPAYTEHAGELRRRHSFGGQGLGLQPPEPVPLLGEGPDGPRDLFDYGEPRAQRDGSRIRPGRLSG